MKIQGAKKNEILPLDMVEERLNSLTGDEGLNIGDDEYCYVKVVGNHLVVGRAKIVLEE